MVSDGLAELYDRMDACALAETVRKGEVHPGELLDAAVARTEERNPALNAVVRLMVDEAREVIAAGLPDGPLAGVPFLLKDLHVHYAGVPTTEGSRFFADRIPARDSEIVARYRRAGLVIFGKTNTPELGTSPSTEPRLHGPTRNPWDLARSPGGSSGGSGAAVAGGIVPAAHASDRGGSIRIPASCCGLFGLKPTRGRTPSGPELGEHSGGLSVEHVLTRSVRDSATLLDVEAGAAPGDPYACPEPPPGGFRAQLGREPVRLRVGLMTTPPLGGAVEPECEEAAQRAGLLCEQLGHLVEEAAPTYDAEAAVDAFALVVAANKRATLRERSDERGGPPGEDDVEPLVAAMLGLGDHHSATDYAQATRTLHRTGRQVAAFYSQFDLMLTPTLAQRPPPLGRLRTFDNDLATYGREALAFTPFTLLANMTGQPAISVPLHTSAEGLPVGAQFVGRFGDEATLLQLAAQLEQAAPWAHRRPPLFR